GERMVEHNGPNPPRLPKIVFSALHGGRAARKAAAVGSQDPAPRNVQNQAIDRCGPALEVRMSAAPVRPRIRAAVRGRCPPLDSASRQRIFDANLERERIARLWIENVLHHGPVWLVLGDCPCIPTNEAVDCIVVLRLVQWELVAPSLELVAAVLQ